MDVTLNMILDYIAKEEVITLDHIHTHVGFSDIRVYYPGIHANPSYLYYHESPAFQPPDAFEACCFVHPIRETQEASAHHHKCILCLCEGGKLLELLQDCFLTYRSWYVDMNRKILEGGSLQELIDISQKIITNPIVIDDAGFRILAFNQERMSQLDDYESTFQVTHRYHSASYVASITSNPIFLRNLKNRHKPFIHHYDFLPHPSIYAPIFFQEKLIGFLTIIGHYMDLTQGMLDFAGILVELLSRAMGYSGVTPYRNSPEDNILLRLIKGEGYDAQIDAVFLEKAGVTPDNLYYIALLRFVPHLDVLISIQQRLIQALEHLLKSKVLADNDTILILVQDKRVPYAQFSGIIDEFSRANGFVVGLSLPFRGVENASYFYRQAACCLTWCQSKDFPGTRCFFYGRFVLYDVLSHFGTSAELAAIKHPALAILESHDQNKVGELKKTMEVFLDCGNDVLKAARQLNIHKNSLYYRLAKISEMTGIDFDNSAVCSHLCLSLSIERMQEISTSATVLEIT